MTLSGQTWRRVIPRLMIALTILVALWIVAARFVTLEEVQRIASAAGAFADRRPLLTALAVIAAQAVGMALSLPTKGLLNLLAAFLLGAWLGGLTTLVGVLAGTTVLFFAARTMLREQALRRLGARAASLEERLTRRPVRAIAGLRLIITLPYGPITVAAALTSVRYRHFLVGSLIGDLPIVALYAAAGERLTDLTSAQQAISPITAVLLVVAGAALVASTLFGPRRARG